MQIFLITFLIFSLAILAMAIGVVLGRRSIKGSCGGLSSVAGLEGACAACAEPCEERKKALQRQATH